MFARSKVRSAHHLTSHIPAHQDCRRPPPLHPSSPFSDLDSVLGFAICFLFYFSRGLMTPSCPGQALEVHKDDLLQSPSVEWLVCSPHPDPSFNLFP